MREEIQSAIALYKSGQTQKAIDLIKILISKYPNEAMLFNLIGVCYSSLNQLNDAVISFKSALIIKEDYAEVHNNLGLSFHGLNQFNKAVKSYENAIALNPNYFEAHNNLGNAFKELKKINAAINSHKKSLEINPEFENAFNNLGLIYFELEELTIAIRYFENSIDVNPHNYEAHNNLGVALKKHGKKNLAVISFKKAIEIKQGFAEAHGNLGQIQTELGELEKAEASLRKAIAINPEFAKAHNNLGNTLKNLGRFEEAKLSYLMAIDLKSDYANAHTNLSIILYATGDINSALISLDKAYSIDPESKLIKLLLAVLRARKSQNSDNNRIEDSNNFDFGKQLTSNPLVLERAVEQELIAKLYEMKALEHYPQTDTIFGNARGSGYQLFQENNNSIIKIVRDDLIRILSKALGSNIYIKDSFFHIMGAGGAGVNRHNHIGELDLDPGLNLIKQKFSLVYYLLVGDQDCSEPGTLKLYDPSEDILPSAGKIVVFPANRYHSVVYNGKKDRIMISINFYSY
jgi:tetratricopeptide (TPR) repeat protein